VKLIIAQNTNVVADKNKPSVSTRQRPPRSGFVQIAIALIDWMNGSYC
jgi:hypothetical protein